MAREPLRNIAERTGTSATALFRHKEEHLPATLAKAQEAGEVAHSDKLLDQLRDLQGKALAILAQAEKAKDLRTALMAVREVRSTLELVGKATGELVSKVEHSGAVGVVSRLSSEQLEAICQRLELLGYRPGAVVEGQVSRIDDTAR